MNLCECGCRQETTLAPRTKGKIKKGQAYRFLPHHSLRNRESKDTIIINCLNCNKETTNPKFCGRSCSTSYNNQLYPKRFPTHFCNNCGKRLTHNSKLCNKCYQITISPKKLIFTNIKNSNWGTSPYVRQHARKMYKNSGRPNYCAICRYDKHIEICHIKDIRSYVEGTLYEIINQDNNLIALCKNCHWEFDNEIWFPK